MNLASAASPSAMAWMTTLWNLLRRATSRADVFSLCLGLCLSKAPIHDARRDDGDGPGGDDRDESEDERKPDAQAHRRAPR